MLIKIFRYLYLILSWAFLAGVVYQTYTAGLAAVAETTGWSTHFGLGMLLLLAALLQLILIRPARLPRPAGWVSLGLFGTILVQVLVVGNRASNVSALHPVLALFVFWMSWWLAMTAARTVRGATSGALAGVGEDA
ncbi:MAG TPA: DUF6220 domain-containing protein [Anaerolineales bacterium]|nr:DUF6220 domain-containing protein [Anaerolineales bacterium]